MAVITISRQYGSGGDAIAHRVSELLGCRYFDKWLMAEIAHEAGLTEEEIVEFSADYFKTRKFLNMLLVGLQNPDEMPRIQEWQAQAVGKDPADMPQLDDAKSIALVRGTIEAAYKRGNVVIVGRGGQALLRNMPDVLHVRIEAPFEMRVRRIQEQASVDSQTAEEIVVERDETVRTYLKAYYDIDWIDPMLYDLVVNTEKLGIEAAARLIVDAVSYLPMAKLMADRVNSVTPVT